MALPLIPIAVALAQEFLPDIVGSIFGDTSGKVAQTVVDTALTITGAGSAEAAAEVLRSDPALVFQWRAKVLEENRLLEEAYLGDRQNARTMAVERLKSGGSDKRPNIMLACCALVLVACITAMMAPVYASIPLPGEVIGILATITGGCVKMLGDAFAFEFGSSRGSKDKDAILAVRQMVDPGGNV